MMEESNLENHSGLNVFAMGNIQLNGVFVVLVWRVTIGKEKK